MESYLKANEACQLLGISLSLLYKMTAAGSIPCLHIGRAVRFIPEDLKLWQTKNMTGGPVELI